MSAPLRDEAVPPAGADSHHAPKWAVWHHQFDLVRSVDGLRYLRRWWVVKTPWGGIILHRMDTGDARETLHDHPFSFVSIVLRGGYVERRLDPRAMTVNEEHIVRRVNLMRRQDAHSIRRLLRVPTWTLLFVGRHRRKWGFLEPVNPFPPERYEKWMEQIAAAFDLPPGLRVLMMARDERWMWTPFDAFDSGHYVP